MIALQVYSPPQRLVIEERLVWKYEETRYATKPTSSKISVFEVALYGPIY